MTLFSRAGELKFKMTEGVFASIPEYYMLGQILKLWRNGLSFQHVGLVHADRFRSQMDVFTISGIFIRQIPFEMISSSPVGDGTFFSADQNRLYRIRFGELSSDHLKKFNLLLHEFAMTVSSPPTFT